MCIYSINQIFGLGLVGFSDPSVNFTLETNDGRITNLEGVEQLSDN